MARAEWGVDPDFFGPRHAHREGRILRRLDEVAPRPGLHLECAAGVGSLSAALAAAGRSVVAADASLRSLAVLRAAMGDRRVAPVVADVTALPFADASFATATSAETLEHVPADGAALVELGRVLAPGGWLVGTVPAGPEQWSDWDEWAGHLRRYTAPAMERLLTGAGLDGRATVWGWPLVRLYDDLFLKRVNRRRLHATGSVADDPTLRTVAGLGQRRWLVRLVRSLFALDRVGDGSRRGVGLLFSARKGATYPKVNNLPAAD